MSSDSLLSLALTLPEPDPEPELLTLLSSLRYSNISTLTSSARMPKMHKANACVFTTSLFKRTYLDTLLVSVIYTCLQPECKYLTTVVTIKVTSTSNLLKHYHACYKGIFTS
jgi:hypothetical protein